MGGATVRSIPAGVAGLNREVERALACGMSGVKRLEVRFVYDACSEGVGLREGPRISQTDLDGWDTFSSSRVDWGVGVAETEERKA
jgi:hypothetical protein